MITTVFTVFVTAVLTSLGWKVYLDRVEDELESRAYEKGLTRGYDAGSANSKMEYEKGFRDGVELKEGDLERGYSAGYDRGAMAARLAAEAKSKPKKTPVKKAKKVTSHGD